MLNVQLDEDVAKDMLYEELNKWNIDGTERELLYDYFDECVDNGFLTVESSTRQSLWIIFM